VKVFLIILGLFLLVIVCLLLFIAQPVRSSASKTSAIKIDPQRLQEHVRMLSETFAPRDWEHRENLDRASAYIAKHFSGAGGRVFEQNYKIGSAEYRNVVASFGPEGGERVIVGAHYDAFDIFPAADDNASGVAALLELASALATARLLSRVDLVAYTLEEPPFFTTESMGSLRHARSLKQAGARVKGMISLEMVGYFTDIPNSQRYPYPGLGLAYGTRGDFIVVAGRGQDWRLVRRVKSAMTRANRLPVHSINAPVPGLEFSDHWSYWQQGYPAVMVTDSAFYRNPNYHQANDTAHTLDYGRMGLLVEQIYSAVLELAGAQYLETSGQWSAGHR